MRTTNKISKSQVMNTAWAIYRNKQVNDFSEALSKAWRAIKLKTRLFAGEVKFRYRKMDGTMRIAFGTLNLKNVHYEFKGEGRKQNLTVVPYFDLERKAFRSFRVASLI